MQGTEARILDGQAASPDNGRLGGRGWEANTNIYKPGSGTGQLTTWLEIDFKNVNFRYLSLYKRISSASLFHLSTEKLPSTFFSGILLLPACH